MNLSKTVLILLIIYMIAVNSIDAQDKPENSLVAISSSIDSYKGRTLSMILRLRNTDYVMERIVFYDADNVDIVFDITGFRKNKKLKSCLLNAREGVRFSVNFIVREINPDGLVAGELMDFTPLFIEKMP
jgi:hypothetical protein